MAKRILTLFCWLSLFGLYSASAQELNCEVQVLAQRLQNTDPQIVKTLENSIREFLNNRKWTADVYKPEERIECKVLVNLTKELGSDYYQASLTIQSSRPVYNSSYNSQMLYHVDNDFVFQYAQYQQFIYNENTFNDNLTSMLAYYAYIIIGLDYDSFSPKGGDKYFQKAMSIVNSVPPNLGGDRAPGWKPTDGNRNRYWLIENILGAKYAAIRETIYDYHMKGLDGMYQNPNKGRLEVYNALEKMQEVAERFPNSMIIAVFFNAKQDELIKMFQGAPPNEKAKALQLLYKIDPSNSQNYKKILE